MQILSLEGRSEFDRTRCYELDPDSRMSTRCFPSHKPTIIEDCGSDWRTQIDDPVQRRRCRSFPPFDPEQSRPSSALRSDPFAFDANPRSLDPTQPDPSRVWAFCPDPSSPFWASRSSPTLIFLFNTYLIIYTCTFMNLIMINFLRA